MMSRLSFWKGHRDLNFYFQKFYSTADTFLHFTTMRMDRQGVELGFETRGMKLGKRAYYWTNNFFTQFTSVMIIQFFFQFKSVYSIPSVFGLGLALLNHCEEVSH